MRQTLLVLCCALFSVAGCGDDTTSKNGDMSAGADLATPADLAVRVPNGVACGSMTCAVGQDCCVATANNMVTGETCVAPTASCAGSTLACDGPEDCNTSGSAGAFCCATLNLAAATVDGGIPNFAGGDSSCTASCSFTIATDFSSVKTRLCQQNSDCAGLTVPFIGTATSCCSSASAPNLHFCAIAVPGTITCP